MVKALCVYPHDSSPNPTLDGHYLDLVVLNSAPPCFPKNELVAFLYVGFLSAISLIRFVTLIQV